MKKFILPAALILTGLTILIFTLGPLFTWKFLYLPAVARTSFLSPVGHSAYSAKFGEILNQNNSAENHNFRQVRLKPANRPQKFSLTIEKLNIVNAKVAVDSNDFLSSLAHYPGSVLPGQKGNVVITGHSALPQLFDPARYWAIFSKLYQLDGGDEVVLTIDSESYSYIVERIEEVKPTDTQVLTAPDPYGTYLTLLTCLPGGLTAGRIVAFARLVSDGGIL